MAIHLFMSPTEEVLQIAPGIIRDYGFSFLLLPLNIFSTYYFQAVIKPQAAFVVSVARGLVISGILILALPAIAERKPTFSYPIHIGHSFYPSVNQPFEQTMGIYEEQTRIIWELAAKSECVIVGRCADYILRERHPFRLFVYADMESKIKRCREKGPEEERLSDKELKQKILGIDRRRAKYYGLYTGHAWGDKLNFDLCINTTRTVIKDIVPAIARLF